MSKVYLNCNFNSFHIPGAESFRYSFRVPSLFTSNNPFLTGNLLCVQYDVKFIHYHVNIACNTFSFDNYLPQDIQGLRTPQGDTSLLKRFRKQIPL